MGNVTMCERCSERPVKALGMCQRCYDRARSPRIRPACERCGDRPRHRHGLCKRCDRLEDPEHAHAVDRRSNERRQPPRRRPPRMPSEPRPPVAAARTCVGCGREFEGRGRAKWCSDRCRKQTLYAGVCVDCGAPTNGYNGPDKAAKRCHRCAMRSQAENARWTRDAIVGAIREWAERFSRPPTATEWSTAANRSAAGSRCALPVHIRGPAEVRAVEHRDPRGRP